MAAGSVDPDINDFNDAVFAGSLFKPTITGLKRYISNRYSNLIKTLFH